MDFEDGVLISFVRKLSVVIFFYDCLSHSDSQAVVDGWRTSALNENDIRRLVSPTFCHHHNFFCSSIHHFFFTIICPYIHHCPSNSHLYHWSNHITAPYCNTITIFPHRSCFCLPTNSIICHASLDLSVSLFPPRPFSRSLSPSLQTPRGSSFTEITWPSALSVPRHPRCPHTVSLHFQRSLDQPSEHAQQCIAAHHTGRYTTLYRSYSTQV